MEVFIFVKSFLDFLKNVKGKFLQKFLKIKVYIKITNFYIGAIKIL